MTKSSLQTLLARQFPETAFDMDVSDSNNLHIFWESDSPTNEQVAALFQAGGVPVSVNPAVPGHVKVRRNGGQAAAQQPWPKKGTAHSPKQRSRPSAPSFGAQGLWSISDLEVIRTTAERWVRSLSSPGTIAYYAGGMSLLMIASGYLAWVLDIRPSLIFGQHLAAQLSSEWINPQLLTAVVLLLSITPNLLEFFATGLAAHGNVIVDISIKAALLFDAATDAPMAYSISKAMVVFFVPETGFWFNFLIVITALPVLLISTVVVEILFLSFLTTFVLLIRRSLEVRRAPSRRSYG